MILEVIGLLSRVPQCLSLKGIVVGAGILSDKAIESKFCDNWRQSSCNKCEVSQYRYRVAATTAQRLIVESSEPLVIPRETSADFFSSWRRDKSCISMLDMMVNKKAM